MVGRIGICRLTGALARSSRLDCSKYTLAMSQKRLTTGLNSASFERALLADRLETARRFLPQASVFAALVLILFAALDVAVDAANWRSAFAVRLAGALVLVALALLVRRRMPGWLLETLLCLPPLVLVCTVAGAAAMLQQGFARYFGGIALMFTLSGAWLTRPQTFVATNVLAFFVVCSLAWAHQVRGAVLQDLLWTSLLGVLCGGIFYDFLLRANRRALGLQLELKTESRTDMLTGLPNRRAFLERAEDMAHRSRRRGRCLSVLLIDADHFKAVNDQYGHDAGDAVLQCLASAIANALDGPSNCGRLGGEEFAVLVPDLRSDAALELGEKLCAAVRQFDWELENLPKLTVSIGVASSEAPELFATMLRAADQALYAAKNQGRDRACLAPKPSPVV